MATYGIAWAIDQGLLEPSKRLNRKQLKGIFLGGLLHDIGKIGVPDEVLNKPGKLTDEEYESIKRHPTIGYEGLKEVPFIWKEVLPIVRHHHEKWNGHGYPTGCSGHDIPFEAQIIGIADFYDALTTSRPYREPFPSRKALAIIIEEKGTFFNPILADAFEGIIERVEKVTDWIENSPEGPTNPERAKEYTKEPIDALEISWNFKIEEHQRKQVG